MKDKIIAAVLLLGAMAFGAFALVAELGLLPEASETWAPWALVAFGVLLLIFAWRSRSRLIAWVFKQGDRQSMK